MQIKSRTSNTIRKSGKGDVGERSEEWTFVKY
jgi:hypothetical protein